MPENGRFFALFDQSQSEALSSVNAEYENQWYNENFEIVCCVIFTNK